MGPRKGPILPIQRTNNPHKTPVKNREVYVGPLPPPAADKVAKYPVLGSYPAVELIRATLAANGSRRAPLFAIAPGLKGFGEYRVPATVEQPTADVTVLRCTVRLPPGRYAAGCDAGAFEVAVARAGGGGRE